MTPSDCEDYLKRMNPADKAMCFDRIIKAYSAGGHQAAYLTIDAIFERAALSRPWQRGEQL